MNFSEQFVASAFQSLGYFVIQGLKVGVREADLLAIRINNGKPEYYHIEIQVSHNPVGVLRAQSKFGQTAKNPMKAAKDFINKKFLQKDLVKAIEKCLGTRQYKRIFVHGILKETEQLRILKKRGIECIALESLLSEADKSSCKTNAFVDFHAISRLAHKKTI